MTRITLDAALRARLNGRGEQLDLCDESGLTLGFFVPASPAGPPRDDDARSPICDEELERRSREPGGRTLAEIRAELGRP